MVGIEKFLHGAAAAKPRISVLSNLQIWLDMGNIRHGGLQ
jgi:hypothetical protein